MGPTGMKKIFQTNLVLSQQMYQENRLKVIRRSVKVLPYFLLKKGHI